MAGARNILVHDHARVDPGIPHRLVTDQLGDFCEFARQVLAFLDRTQPPQE